MPKYLCLDFFCSRHTEQVRLLHFWLGLQTVNSIVAIVVVLSHWCSAGCILLLSKQIHYAADWFPIFVKFVDLCLGFASFMSCRARIAGGKTHNLFNLVHPLSSERRSRFGVSLRFISKIYDLYGILFGSSLRVTWGWVVWSSVLVYVVRRLPN